MLKEPLLHFLVVGSLLFFYLSSTDNESTSEIVISQGKIDQLTSQFTKTRNRPPTAEEKKGLLKFKYVRTLHLNMV